MDRRREFIVSVLVDGGTPEYVVREVVLSRVKQTVGISGIKSVGVRRKNASKVRVGLSSILDMLNPFRRV